MAHGYIGDDYGIDGGMDRGEDRERGSRDPDRSRDRGRMFGGGRGWSDEDRWSERGWRGEGYGHEDGGFAGRDDYSEGRRSFSAHPDDHYRSWRDRHMSELDRDYQDYCREREQQFHQDFDAWRRQRQANYQPLRTGMTNSGVSHDPSGQVQAETEGMTTQSDPTDAATLGTNNAETTAGEIGTTGRRRR